MRVTVRLFAGLRERAGAGRHDLELRDGAGVEDVWPALGLGEEPAGLVYAVNRAYVERDQALDPGNALEIARAALADASQNDRAPSRPCRQQRCA